MNFNTRYILQRTETRCLNKNLNTSIRGIIHMVKRYNPGVHQLITGYSIQFHTMEHYSAVERSKVLIHAEIWIILEHFKRKKPDTDSHILCDSIHMNYSE